MTLYTEALLNRFLWDPLLVLLILLVAVTGLILGALAALLVLKYVWILAVVAGAYLLGLGISGFVDGVFGLYTETTVRQPLTELERSDSESVPNPLTTEDRAARMSS